MIAKGFVQNNAYFLLCVKKRIEYAGSRRKAWIKCCTNPLLLEVDFVFKPHASAAVVGHDSFTIYDPPPTTIFMGNFHRELCFRHSSGVSSKSLQHPQLPCVILYTDQ